MTPGPIFTDAQLKLWLRRVNTEMSKGTPPEETLELVKATMHAQNAGQAPLLSAEDSTQKAAKNSKKRCRE